MTPDSDAASVITTQATVRSVRSTPAWAAPVCVSGPGRTRVAASMMGSDRCLRDRRQTIRLAHTVKTEPSHRGSVVEVLPDWEVVEIGVTRAMDSINDFLEDILPSLSADDTEMFRHPYVCGGCGASLSPVFKFCPGCGSAVVVDHNAQPMSAETSAKTERWVR